VTLFIGDLNDEDKVLSWLTSQDVFEIKNEIDEVNKKMLTKLLNENEFVTVFFCKYLLVQHYMGSSYQYCSSTSAELLFYNFFFFF